MRRLLYVVAISVVLAFVMFGCNRSDKSSGNVLIGIAMPESHVLRWVKDGNALKDEVERRGYRAELQFADANQAIQNRQIQSFLTLGAKLLIVGSISEEAAPAIAAAAEENVAVIAYDRLIHNSDAYDYYITFNNFKVGELKGQALVQGLNLNEVTADAPKLITLFAGAPTDGNAFFFFDGAMSILNPHIDRGALKVVGPYPRTSDDKENFLKISTENWMDTIAAARMARLLATDAADVVLDAVLAPNDVVSRAITEVLRAHPKYQEKLPLITGQDAEFHSMLSIKDGIQFCTVFKNTTKLAEAAVILADQILKGQPINIPGAILATGNLAKLGDTGLKTVKAYLLDPVLITRDNLLVPVDAGFYTEAESAALRD